MKSRRVVPAARQRGKPGHRRGGIGSLGVARVLHLRHPCHRIGLSRIRRQGVFGHREACAIATSPTPAARSWIALFERHQVEIRQLAVKDRTLKALAGELIAMAGSAIDGDEPIDEHVELARPGMLKRVAKSKPSTSLRRDLVKVAPALGGWRGKRAK